MSHPDRQAIAAWYERFAQAEAHGHSALYEAFAHGVAQDQVLLDRLAALPRDKQQPNLLFAAVRHLAGIAADWPAFRHAALDRWDEVRHVMLTRSTQTNEPGRCAVLLPLLASLPQPLALIEVGASAGLCLLPDRYGYDYEIEGVHQQVAPGAGALPVFPCRTSLNTPIPLDPIRVAWRAGLDLNPLDVGNPEQTDWLETLVWPEQTGRAVRLREAVGLARTDPPRVVQGDLREGVAALAAQAPADATLVIFHTAVLAYVPEASERQGFAASMGALCNYWISNEAPGVFPDIATRAPVPAPRGRFLMALNGEPVAWTDPHGGAMEWIADPLLRAGGEG